MKCTICHNDSQGIFGESKWEIEQGERNFKYLYCPICRLAFCDPVPTKEELNRYYSTQFDFGWYEKRRLLKKIQGHHRWSVVRGKIEKLLGRKGKLFDAGCGEGWFVQAAKKSGWDVAGCDLSPSAAKANDLNISQGSIESLDIKAGSYDAISMWHSLEHMMDPAEVLGKAKLMLKKSGLVLVAVPNYESRGQKRCGASWVWLQQPFVHLWQFTPQSLQQCFEKAGYEVVEVWTRDTWDAQYYFDAVLAPKSERFLRKMAYYIGAIFRRLSYKKYEEVQEQTYFLASESLRLSVYVFTLVTGAPKYEGSELLIIARIKN